MIVSCQNCNKKFNIDKKLIPEKGRLLQCSKCNHKWHYIIQNKENETLENANLSNKIKNISNDNKKKISINPSSLQKKVNNQKINGNIKKIKSVDRINKNISLENIFRNLIIIFILFIALILILDTFKADISNYLPIINPLLDSLYLSFFDLISFIKDLFN